MTSPLYGPIATLVALTVAVWALAVTRRVREIRRRRLPLQTFARASDTANALQDSRAMDNFNNLLQVPLLFYVLCVMLAQSGEVGELYLAGAWAFVGLRLLHSAIQVTCNRVLYRFYAWVLGCLLLFGMWCNFAIDQFMR